MGRANDYIDLHGVCASAGEPVQFFLTLYYAPMPVRALGVSKAGAKTVSDYAQFGWHRSGD
jgi:hypothetical protein